MTFAGINLNYVVASNHNEQVYPALQVTNYQPRSLAESIDFCLSDILVFTGSRFAGDIREP